MPFLEFILRHFFEYGIVLEVLFIIGQALFLFKYLKRNIAVSISLITNIISVLIFFIWCIYIYIDYLALGNWGGSLGLAYSSLLLFFPVVGLSLLVSIVFLLIGIIGAAREKGRIQKIGILIAIFTIIILLGGIFVYQYLPTRIEFTSWKTYTNSEVKFSIDYPSTWGFSRSTIGSFSYVFFRGEEGSISIDYGTGFNRVCRESSEKMQVGSEEFYVCQHDITNGIERWFLDKEYDTMGIEITAIAEKPNEKTKETILKMLSTFKFTK